MCVGCVSVVSYIVYSRINLIVINNVLLELMLVVNNSIILYILLLLLDRIAFC